MRLEAVGFDVHLGVTATLLLPSAPFRLRRENYIFAKRNESVSHARPLSL